MAALVLVLSAMYVGVGLAVARRSHREIASAMPRGVLERLAAHDGSAIHLDIRQGGLVWNPEAPLGGRNFLYGPGHARFSQDADGFVCLDWAPRWGQPRHLRGPAPDLPEEHRVPIRHTAKIVAVLLGVYLVVLGGWWTVSSR